MAFETLRTMRQLLLSSILAQLMLVGGGMLGLALCFGGTGAIGAAIAFQAALPSLLAVVLMATSARAARRTVDGYETLPMDLVEDLARVAPRVATQVGALVLGCVVLWFLAMAAATLHPLAGLVALPLALVASALVAAPLLLAVGAIASGDEGWLPGAAFELLRRSPGYCTGLAVVGVVVAALLALPAALIGLIASMLLGPVGPLGLGLAAVSIVPWLGCGSLAAWRTLDGDALLRERLERRDASAAEELAHAVVPAGRQGRAAAIAPPAAQPTGWVPGPTWDVAVDAGSAFGTWVRMPAPSRVALAITWHAGVAPELAIAGPDGAWWRPGDPAASGASVLADLPAGDSYLQVSSRSTVPQALGIAMLLPEHAAA